MASWISSSRSLSFLDFISNRRWRVYHRRATIGSAIQVPRRSRRVSTFGRLNEQRMFGLRNEPYAGGAGRGAPPGAEASPVTSAFRRAPGGAVRRQAPRPGSFRKAPSGVLRFDQPPIAARCSPDSCSMSLCRLLPCASIVTIAGKSLTVRCHIASGVPNSSSETPLTPVIARA